jgi:hypothetical protein
MAERKNSEVKKMWEHRTVSNKEFSTTGRLNPSETYVRLMDEVEQTVKHAQIENLLMRLSWIIFHVEVHGKNYQRLIWQNPIQEPDILDQQKLNYSTQTYFLVQLGLKQSDLNLKEESSMFQIS